MRQIIIFSVILDLLLVVFSIYKQNSYLINSQLAFVSSLAIAFGSFYSYNKLMKNRALEVKFDDEEDEANLSKFKSVKNALSNLNQSKYGFLSPFRALGYIFLILSLFYLRRQGSFDVIAFFAGLFVLPCGVFLYMIFGRFIKQT